MNKKSLARFVGFVAVAALVVAACGGGDKTAASNAKNSSTTKPANAGKAPKTGPGFDGTTIKLGVITPQSGAIGKVVADAIGTPLTSGNQVYWDAVNAKGGVAGKYKVQLETGDSQYDATIGLQAYDKIKNDVAAFQQVLGTQVLQAMQPKLQVDQVSASPATLDAAWTLDPNLIPIATSYQLLSINGIDYYLNNGGSKTKNICLLAQDDAYGEAGVQGATYEAQKAGFTIKTTQRYPTLTDKTAQIQALKDNACDAVLFVATLADTKSAIQTAVQIKFNARWIALSPAWQPTYVSASETDASFKTYLQQNMWVSSTGVAWDSPLNQQMLADQAKYAPTQKPDPYFAYGYAQAQAMDQILAVAVKNGDLSRTGILNAINGVGTLKFGGALPDFVYGTSVSTRKQPTAATIFGVDPAAPEGLKALNANYTSAAAKTFKFTP
ncbi:MAG: branched-chain amino acid transporter substrate-binding protein [Actinomycetia bacterium]|nr:branched-chain amino acid transporter substrate-binding protein [Actinomycetes bacterium]